MTIWKCEGNVVGQSFIHSWGRQFWGCRRALSSDVDGSKTASKFKQKFIVVHGFKNQN